MTEINFYVSQQQGLEQRFAVAYRLLNIALQRKLAVHIHTDAPATSQQFDDYLWVQEPSSFIPHELIDANESNTLSKNTAPETSAQTLLSPVTISHNFEPLHNCDYLINLSAELPPFFSRFTKLAEIIDKQADVLTAGRERYAFYRDRGYTLGYHQL